MTSVNFTTPVMRYVQGDVFVAQEKDAQGNPLVVKTGPNAGQPAPRFFAAGAIPKNDPAWPAFEQILKQVAAASFPHLFPQGPNGPCVNPNFSYKIVDGDGVDQNGKPNNQKEGFAGHWVLRFSTSFKPGVYPKGQYDQMHQIQDKNLFRRGYYFRIAGTASGNDNAQRPGIYLNMNLIEHCGYGPEIVSGPSAQDAFGSAPAVLPPGASATPLAGTAPAAVAPQAMPAPMQPSAPTPTAYPTSPAPQPYTGYMQPQTAVPAPTPAPMAPPPAPAPMAPPAAPARVMTAKAAGAPYESFVAQGWNDDMLRQHGYMQ